MGTTFQGNLPFALGLFTTALVCSIVHVDGQILVPVPGPSIRTVVNVAALPIRYSPSVVIARSLSNLASRVRSTSIIAARYGTVAAVSASLGAVGGGTGVAAFYECPGGFIYSQGAYRCTGEDGRARRGVGWE